MNTGNNKSIRERISLFILCLIVLTACSDYLGTHSLPSGISDPEVFKNEEGAINLAKRAEQEFQTAVRGYIVTSALFTDEGMSTHNPFSGLGLEDRSILVDRRSVEEKNVIHVYSQLQMARNYSRIAREFIHEYAPSIASTWKPRLFAYEGYVKLYLADLFCSGVPLSTLDFEGDFTYKIPSSTADIYASALSSFDSARALADTPSEILHLSLIGSLRAMVALEMFEDAVLIASEIPDNFIYTVSVSDDYLRKSQHYTASSEGGNGYPYGSSGDSRVEVVTLGLNRIPRKLLDTYHIEIASFKEVELVKAEAALLIGDTIEWLSTVNRLRQTQSELPAITDPQDDSLRLDLLFDERAAWLFYTGHRQADLRRLVRSYGRNQYEVYPSGPYKGTYLEYGNSVNIPVPVTERANPHFNGCLSRNA